VTHPARAALEEIVGAVAPGAVLAAARAMDEGGSAVITALDLEHRDGRAETILLRQAGATNLKADPHAAANEARVLDALGRRGLPVARVLHVDESCTRAERPFLVVSWLDGAPDYDPADRAGAALQMADFLAALHRIDAEADDLRAVARHDGPPGYLARDRDRQPEAFRPAHDHLTRSTTPADRNGPVLLHGDLWSGNLLWQEGRLTGVIDWEDAAIGDPLIDLSVARGDMAWGLGFAAMDTFTARYAARTGFDLTALPHWDLRAALRQAPHAADFAEGWQELGRTDITEATILAAHQRMIDEALTSLGSNV